MTKEVYIVTGGSGFVGNNLIRELEKQGKEVVAFARSKEKCSQALKGTKAKIIYGTVMNIDDLEGLFIGYDKDVRFIFIHTASVVYLGNNRKRLKHMYKTNIYGNRNVVDACLKHNARFVYVSSVHAIPEGKKGSQIVEVDHFNPKEVVGHYAKSKSQASQLVLDAVKNDGLDAVIIHPSGIIGPCDFSDTHLTQMVDDYRAGRIPAAVRGGYDFVDVRDVVNGTIAAAQNGKCGECYLLTNKFYTVREVLDYLYELGVGKRVKRTLPLWLARTGLPFLTMYTNIRKKRPLYTKYSLYTLGSNSNFSHEKATKEFGYKPRELKESLNDMV